MSTPSVWRHLRHHPATILLVGMTVVPPLVIFVMKTVRPDVGPKGHQLANLYGMFGLMALGGLALLTVVAWRIRRLLRVGRRVTGQCTRHGLSQAGMTELGLRFALDGVPHETRVSAPTGKLPPVGSDVALIVDPDRPQRLLVCYD